MIDWQNEVPWNFLGVLPAISHDLWVYFIPKFCKLAHICTLFVGD